MPPKTERLAFKPLEKREDIHLFYLSDVHYSFDIAKRTATYFERDVDLFVFNGDLGEVETEENYLEVCRFVGEITKGEIPAIFSRGNHDTRGRLSERFTDYFPHRNKKTYYSFEVGCLKGVVLDCGEDKPDWRAEYDFSKDTPKEWLGVNRFHEYRQRQLEFLRGIQQDREKITFAVSHVCPAMTTRQAGGEFDIDREIYTEWCRELDRIAPSFMLCGHFTTPFSSSRTTGKPCFRYPVVVGTNRIPGNASQHFWGTAVILNKEGAEVRFTDETHTVQERHLLAFS